MTTPSSVFELTVAETQLLHKLRRLQSGPLYFLTLRLLHSIIDFTLTYQAAPSRPRPEETSHAP
jgi:hypothetical protein